MREQGDCVALNGQRGESVGNGDGQIARDGTKLGDGVGIELAAEIRMAQIGCAIGCIAAQLEDWNAGFAQDWKLADKALRERKEMQFCMNGVPGLCVGKLKTEHFSRRDAVARGWK